MDTAAVILSGGMSRRMGSDKSLLKLDEKTFLQRAAEEYLQWFDKVFISVNLHGRFPLPSGTEELLDNFPGSGPMAGLQAALATGFEAVFLSAVDLPFASGAAAVEMIHLLEGSDACAIKKDTYFEPAFAAYSKSCLPDATTLLQSGENRMGLLLRRVNTRWIGHKELGHFDVDRILLNVNRPDDLSKIMASV